VSSAPARRLDELATPHAYQRLDALSEPGALYLRH
jgi:hypothetical protein